MTTQRIHRKDYQSPQYAIEHIHLTFLLDKHRTQVQAVMQLTRIPEQTPCPLVLMGEQLTLTAITVNGEALAESAYTVTPTTLTILDVPNTFELCITTLIDPANNTTLMGLYYADLLFCTQCEAQGFRRMTYFLDRPDVLTTYKTTIIADKIDFPVLLSNGNCIDSGEGDNNTHWVTWHDPFKKPCYLFALVAGQLDCLEDHYQTQSGRQVQLRIFVEPGKKLRAQHAMFALKQAMQWDEQAFGREYDLDIFMIVAVSSFNMGAMENKGLNIFNDKYILVDPKTATDADYDAVTLVVGHEYFHNWTGNRITCRDWFQLSLKEGLTVFRESLFMQQQTSPILRRIQDARTIRSAQFAEDASRMAHPVRPDSYAEINNFYTVTIYNKGAEVIRMLYTLMGEVGFRRGMDEYFARYDGQAVTIDDFVDAIAMPNQFDYQQFLLWYSQAGTPIMKIKPSYDASHQRYTLTCTQQCPATPGQTTKQPFYIPISIGLIDPVTQSSQQDTVLHFTQAQQKFHFDNLTQEPVPSLFRDFSAPVKFEFPYTDEQLLYLFQYDTDEFNRWDALQQLLSQWMLAIILAHQDKHSLPVNISLLEAINNLLQDDKTANTRFIAECLVLPSESYLAQQVEVIDVDAIYTAREFVRQCIAKHCATALLDSYHRCHTADAYDYNRQDIAKRALKNICLSYLLLNDVTQHLSLCVAQIEQADNMTDYIAALSILADYDMPATQTALDQFYQTWRHDPLVLDKWFAIQAQSRLPNRLEKVKSLMKLPEFNLQNPNRVRALIGAFVIGNPVKFHNNQGYAFLTDIIIQLQQANPQLAARLLMPFSQWRRYDKKHQKLMQAALNAIQQVDNLSRDVAEIVENSLA